MEFGVTCTIRWYANLASAFPPAPTCPVTTNCEIFNAEEGKEEGTEDVVLHLMKTNRLVSPLPSFLPLLWRRRGRRNGGPTVLCAERLLALYSLPFGAFSAFCLLCRAPFKVSNLEEIIFHS